MQNKVKIKKESMRLYNFLKAIIFMSLVIFVSLASSVFAGEMNELAHKELLRSEKFLKTISKEKSEFAGYKQTADKNIEKHIKEHKEIITNAINLANQNKKNMVEQSINLSNLNLKKPTPKAIIFVSFGMPDLSLKQIINDAAKYQIPVVVRGLIDNSFKKTAARVFELVKENNKGGISINPIWFKRYSINTVPACVVQGGDDFDVIYGNIRLKNMLEIIAASGTTGTIAQSILDEVKV